VSDAARIAAGLEALAELAGRTVPLAEGMAPIVAAMRGVLAGGGTLFFAGNGGSAADAQHLATEYVVRYHAGQRRGLRAIALTTDTSALTAGGNDFGFDEIFARQLEALRVSLWAQQLGTPRPVSEQRIYRAIDAIVP